MWRSHIRNKISKYRNWSITYHSISPILIVYCFWISFIICCLLYFFYSLSLMLFLISYTLFMFVFTIYTCFDLYLCHPKIISPPYLFWFVLVFPKSSLYKIEIKSAYILSFLNHTCKHSLIIITIRLYSHTLRAKFSIAQLIQ